MGLRVKRCFCLSLQTAGLIHAWLGIMFFSFAITSTITRIINSNSYEVSQKTVVDDVYILTSNNNQEKITSAIYIFDILISVLLIAGITKNKSVLLVPWLILRAVVLIIAIPITLIQMAYAIYAFQPDTLLSACITGLFVWSWIAIYSLYQEISKTQNNITSSTPSTLPHCESQSRPDDDPPPYHLFAK